MNIIVLQLVFTSLAPDLSKISHKRRTGGRLAKVAYHLRGKFSGPGLVFAHSGARSDRRGVPSSTGAAKVMKAILTLIIMGALCLTGRAATNAVLRGIRIVETQDQLHPPRGKLGERGPYQFRRSTWRMHTSSSFDLAENREVANAVAKRHYAWIEAQLLANGIAPSAYNVALAWNAGVNAVIRGSAPAVANDYATRVLNIAATFPDEKLEPAKSAPDLAVDETPAEPNPTPAPEIVPTPVPVAPAEVVVASASAAQDDSVEVRYYSNSILLALNRTNALSPANGAPAVPLNISSATLVAADLPPAVARL